MRKYALLSILVLCFMPGLVSAASLDWLLDCHPKQEGFDYYAELDKLKNGAVPNSAIVAAIRRDLPHHIIGRNSECIYDAILLFADDSLVAQLKKRQGKPNRADEPGYGEDIIRLLETRSKRYGDQTIFTKEMSRYGHPVSMRHFLDLHLDDMPVRAKLAVILYVIQEKKLAGDHHYIVPVFLKKIFVASPKEYDEFVSSLSKVPLEFTCIKDNSCP